MAAVTVKAEVALLFCSDFLPVESKNEVFLWTGEVLRKEPTEGSPKPPDSFRWVILLKKNEIKLKTVCFVCYQLIKICFHLLAAFSPASSTPERARRHAEWPQLATAAATVRPFLPHRPPAGAATEGAVGGQVRVPALLHRILRGAGERVAFPLPVLP